MNGEIVNYKIKPAHADGPFSEFVTFDGTHYRRLNSIVGNWMLDLNIVEHLDCYDEIEDLTETPEEKEAFEAMNKSPYDVGAHVSDASKPVYTRAMCDAGEFPPVGVDCQYETIFFSMDKYNNGTCRPIAYFNGKVWIDIDGGQESVINLNSIKFKPIKTEREKAIDEMVATAVNSADDIAKSIIYEACVKLAEAGYTKEKK